MKLKSALEIGKECGLTTVSEAIVNINMHAMSMFAYDEMSSEYNELVKDFRESGFALEDGINDCLKRL